MSSAERPYAERPNTERKALNINLILVAMDPSQRSGLAKK